MGSKIKFSTAPPINADISIKCNIAGIPEDGWAVLQEQSILANAIETWIASLKEDHSGTKEEHSEPKEKHDEPKENHCEPKEEHSEPKEEHSEPKEDHNEPKEGHNEPKEDHCVQYEGILIKESITDENIIDCMEINKIELFHGDGNPKYWTALFFTSKHSNFPEEISKVMKSGEAKGGQLVC